MPEQLIGTVVHYFKGPSVAVVRVTEGTLAVGDRIRFHGHTTEFTEQITSMEVNHQKVPKRRPATRSPSRSLTAPASTIKSSR